MGKKYFAKLIIGFFILISPLIIDAAEDESAMFGSTNSVVDMQTIKNDNVAAKIESESTSYSGTIYNRSAYNMAKKWFQGGTNSKANAFFAYLEGNINLDIRLKKDFKAYINLDAYYSPQGQPNVKEYNQTRSDGTSTNVKFIETLNTVVNIKEFFLSGDFGRKLYFVLGKQVLQWGRGYFWQPTDLINIDRKDFFNLGNQVREGNFGLKLHVPFGTRANLYGYVDMKDASSFDDVGTAGKMEFLLGGTEFAFSAMQKKGLFPVYGADFSSRVFGWDIWGEAAYSEGDNRLRVRETNIPMGGVSLTPYRERKENVVRACFGFSRSFDYQTTDRIMLTSELFYNSAGYPDNFFNLDPRVTDGFAKSVYKANEYSSYYIAMFMSFQKFLIQDLTWNLNTLMNIEQLSYTVSTGLSWAVVDKCTLGLDLYGFFGPKNTEYTYSGNGMTTALTLSIGF